MRNGFDDSGFWRKAVPYVKPRIHSDGPDTVTLSPTDSLVVRELNEDLLVLYLVDEGDHFLYVQNKHLPADMDHDAFHATAMRNLEALADGKIRCEKLGSIFALSLDCNFEASLLLLDWLWQDSLSEYAPNGAVIAVPSRDVLAFCDREDPDGLAQLAAAVSRVLAVGDHTITDRLFRRTPSGWVRHDA